MINAPLRSRMMALLAGMSFMVALSALGSTSHHHHLSADTYIQNADPSFAKYLFYSNKPNWKDRAYKQLPDGKMIYDAIYTIDNERRRWNPNNQKNSSEANLLFVGCSLTFGEGLNDDQTIPAQVAFQTHHSQTFNYGVNGYSPTHMLSYFKYFDLSKHYAHPEKVTAIYLWGDYHFMRALGSLNHLSWGADTTPYYKMSPAGLIFSGSMSEVFPVKRFLGKLIFGIPILSDFLRKHFIDWPINEHYSDHDIELVIQIIREAKDNYQVKFHNDRFYVAFLPFSDYGISKLQRRLNEMGVRTLNLANGWKNQDINQILIPNDGHPSAYGAKLIASELIKQLNLK